VYVVGIQNDEDSGACLMYNGDFLEAINEERLNRKKLFKGFPEKSLEYILSNQNISISDIDYFAYGWHGQQNDYGDYVFRLMQWTVQAVHAIRARKTTSNKE
jgi:carbamoyltransferase